MLRILAIAAFAFSSLAFPTGLSAQSYPSQPVKLVIPFAPGGGSDVLGRLTAEALTPFLGQNVVVENKPGAGSTLGADYVVRSKPDGYTLLWCPSDAASIAAAIKPDLPYSVPDDFSFVARIAAIPNIVTVNPKLPIHTIKELIDYAKANPGKLRYGSAGVGSGPHMSTALFANAAGIDMVHVPFNGTAPAITAAMGGHIDIVFGAPSLKSFVDAGSLRAIATTGAKRNPNFPHLPTIAESGFPSVVVNIWWGLTAPPGTPEPVLAKLRSAVDQMMNDPKTLERIRKLGFEPDYLPASDFKAFVIKEVEQWKQLAKSANIKLSQ